MRMKEQAITQNCSGQVETRRRSIESRQMSQNGLQKQMSSVFAVADPIFKPCYKFTLSVIDRQIEFQSTLPLAEFFLTFLIQHGESCGSTSFLLCWTVRFYTIGTFSDTNFFSFDACQLEQAGTTGTKRKHTTEKLFC